LVVAEAFGKSGTARITDLQANNANTFTPAYAIYEKNLLSKVAILNYITDPSGASDSYVTISVSGVPNGSSNLNQVKVKYLLAPSVSTKYDVTWANQVRFSEFSREGVN
jgi:hypothetical protein